MKKILIALIRIYKKYVSPYKGTKCPYFPSCSNYGIEAVERHGVFKGLLLTFWRVLRCNPFSKGGVDLGGRRIIKKKIYRKTNFNGGLY